MTISVIIPSLNASSTLPAVLAAFAPARHKQLVSEIIIVDGGSNDDVAKIAAEHDCRFITAAPGRGGQLAKGASSATGDWLMFLHADTVLTPDWADVVADFIAHKDHQKKAAAFQFRLDDDRYQARILEVIVKLRCQLLALPYGDQGLLIHRTLYDELNGFRDLPIMEDVDFISRIGRARLEMLGATAITSAIRYRSHGYIRRMLRNMTSLTMWYLGIPAQRIAAFYNRGAK